MECCKKETGRLQESPFQIIGGGDMSSEPLSYRVGKVCAKTLMVIRKPLKITRRVLYVIFAVIWVALSVAWFIGSIPYIVAMLIFWALILGLVYLIKKAYPHVRKVIENRFVYKDKNITELKKALMRRKSLTSEEADRLIEDMRVDVALGEHPYEVLHNAGLGTVYESDLLGDRF
jgi:hypothetical protein